MNYSKKLHSALLFLVFITISMTGAMAQGPDQVVIKSPGLYPEGLVYDSEEEVFYTTSVSQGRIVKVDKNGNLTIFADDKDLISTIGLEIDKKRNRLIVCNSDPGASIKSSDGTKGSLAAVIFYNLETGEREKYVDLAAIAPKGGHLANDVTIDPKGNLYITDSLSPIIYKVTKKGVPSIFINDERLAVAPGTFGLNGLTYHPDGYLITAVYNGGSLFKIPLKLPSELEQIELGDKPFPTIDGVLLLGDNSLAVACNNITGGDFKSAVYKVKSDDNWISASTIEVFETGNTFPTTLTKVEDEIYVVYAKLQMLFGGVKPPAQQFEITKVRFEKKS